jgi:tRNA pseudouridine55 synthase
VSSRKAVRRRIDGVLLLNKPRGISSQQAVSRVRHLLNAAKAGHTGTLDPAADGLLPICLGEATKFSHVLLDADKTYLAAVRLGVVTDSGDAEGLVLSRCAPVTDRARILQVLQRLRGDSMQMPPMHSALKHQGVPLYEYARKGVTIERAPRAVTLHRLELIDLAGDVLTLRVHCSKGTYIRVLAQDIGAALGCGASLAALTRERSGELDLAHSKSVALPALEAMAAGERERLLLPVDSLLAAMPALEVTANEARRLLLGQKLNLQHAQFTGLARVYGPNEQFVGLVMVEDGGRAVPQRLLAQDYAKLEKSPPEPV